MSQRLRKNFIRLVFLGSLYLITVIPLLPGLFAALVQLLGIGTLWLFFQSLFEKEEEALLGTLLAAGNPYRIWQLYEQCRPGQTLAWAILPLALWAFLKMERSDGWKKEFGYGVAGALALALVGYSDSIFFCIVAGFAVLAALLFRAPKWCAVIFAAMLLWLPCGIKLISFLIGRAPNPYGTPLHSLMPEGYSLGQMLPGWFYESNHPGLGIGILVGIGIFFWAFFVEEEAVQRQEKVWLILSALAMLCSWRRFPWDYVQRLGGWALRLVSLIDTPTVFLGLASFGLCVPAARAASKPEKAIGKTAGRVVLCIWAALAGMMTVFLCNILQAFPH